MWVVQPHKTEPNRTRLTAGRNQINYPGKVGTPTADMLLVKCLLNSVVSTKGTKFMSIDSSKFYLNTPLPQYKYMKLKLTDILQEVIDKCNLAQNATKEGYIYIEVRKGMYGLPQAGLLDQQLLDKQLNTEGY